MAGTPRTRDMLYLNVFDQLWDLLIRRQIDLDEGEKSFDLGAMLKMDVHTRNLLWDTKH